MRVWRAAQDRNTSTFGKALGTKGLPIRRPVSGVLQELLPIRDSRRESGLDPMRGRFTRSDGAGQGSAVVSSGSWSAIASAERSRIRFGTAIRPCLVSAPPGSHIVA